jgi:DNA polymerase III sliding clamp (beta) subunit (PCNA family)
LALKPFQQINVDDYSLSKVQDNVKAAIDPFSSNPLLDGILLENVSLVSASDNVINHKLGRKIRFWFLIRGPIATASTRIYEITSSIPEKYLTLKTDQDCTVSLWVA